MKYKVINYYARNARVFNTEQDARNAIAAHALTSKASHYTELWAMENDEDGEQIAFFENSQLELQLAD